VGHPEISPPHVEVCKGHGRLERREIRTSGALKGYSDFPGLEQVAEIRKRVVRVKTGEVTDSVTYLATSLPASAANPAQLLALARGHWGIENRLHRVKDDGFGEDRHVQRTHQGGQVTSLLRSVALNLLRGRLLWCDSPSLAVRSQIVAWLPLTVLLFTTPRACGRRL
jgi:hypothetical protein